jgi:hypothetical protein
MCKLRAEAFQWAAVATHAQAFDDFACDQLKISELLQKLGIKVVGFWNVLGHGVNGKMVDCRLW